jgi:hypothetical protein
VPALLVLMAGAVAGTAVSQERADAPPFKVTVTDDHPIKAEPVEPLDAVRRINYQPMGMAVGVRTEANQTLHLSHFPTFNIDGQLYQQGQGGRFEHMNRPLPRGQGRKDREGVTSAAFYGDIHVNATMSVVPTRPAQRGGKRRLDAVLIHYLFENKGKRPHRVGLRAYMDVFIIDNDGALFAAPTVPGKILDGTVLKGKLMPPYLELLQRPNLANPGFVAHLTFDLGPRVDRPDRIVLSRFAAGLGSWEMPAFMAGGDSALGVFWEPKDLKPGAKREIAYAYGQGIATNPEDEGRVAVAVGGSFEPGKLFSVTATVSDPSPGQWLTLELPAGMALVEGRETQPVPEPQGESAASLVLWRGRVLHPGQFAVRVRSSTGVTQGKVVTVTKANG